MIILENPAYTAEAPFVARLRAKEERSYEELVGSYGGLVERVANRMLGTAAESKDISQEVFLKVFLNINRFRGDSCLKTWIFRIAVSEILNQRRSWSRSCRRGALNLDINFVDARRLPSEVLESRQKQVAVWRALGRLSCPRRTVVILRDIEGCSYDAIAQHLGISVGTVKSRLARARADLKGLIDSDVSARAEGKGRKQGS